MTLRRTALALLSLLSLASPALASERVPRIVLDPGHGGLKPGAKGPSGLQEKDIALQIARRVRAKLESVLGAQVYLTREGDGTVPLADRVKFSNGWKPDLFLSIHANSMPTRRMRQRAEGLETYFLAADASGASALAVADRENADAPTVKRAAGESTLAFILDDLARMEAHADSSRLAHAVHPKLVATTGAPDRGVHQAPFYVLNGVEAPAILIEVGYISHPEEGVKLSRAEYQETLADAVAAGVKDFLAEVSGKRQPAVSPPSAASGTP
ncbi:N-acetylmuramoyl-L-alanine amidase [Myxococcaceae bacterium GXIMD 01537]